MTEASLITFDQDFKVGFKPAEIEFKDYEALKAKVEGTVKGWSDYVVTAESYPSDKKTRAELNRIKKALNDQKIKINNQVTGSVKEFNEQIKYLVNEIDIATNKLSEGINFYKDKEKKERHQQNLIQLGKIAQDYGIDLQKLEYNSKWDNKTASWTNTEKEARSQFEALKKEQQAKEEAQQVIIDKANSYTKPAMTPSSYLELLEYKSLPDILKQMESDHEYLKQQAEKQAERKRKEVQSIEKKGDKYINAKTGEVAKEVYSLTLELTGSKEQLSALSRFIKDWGIAYKRVK